jgi:type I restriction enzyme S subunit
MENQKIDSLNIAILPGYKSSPVGVIPEDWEVKKLELLIQKVGSGTTPTGGREVYVNTGIPLIRSQNVLNGKLDLSDVVFITEQQHFKMKSTHLQPQDILLNITGASIGRSCVVPDSLVAANVNQHVCIIRLKTTLEPFFLNQYFISPDGQKLIDSYQAGGNRQGLNFEQIKSFKIPLPPLPEQRRIAEILSIWDTAIERTQALLTALQTRHRGLLQQLLTGQKRLPGFEGEWKEQKAGEVFKSVSVKNHPHEELLSATQERGVIPRSMLEGRVTMPENETKQYKLVEIGDFIISLRSFQGGLEYSEYRGLVVRPILFLNPNKALTTHFISTISSPSVSSESWG